MHHRCVPLIAFVMYTLSSIAPLDAQVANKPPGITIDVIRGEMWSLSQHGPQYGIRLSYWMNHWLSMGLEVFDAADMTNLVEANEKPFRFSRQDILLGLHMRQFGFIQPYGIVTWGYHFQPLATTWIDDGNHRSSHQIVLEEGYRQGYTVKMGLAFEFRDMRLYIENGGGNIGTGHVETNFGLSYALRSLPMPKNLQFGRPTMRLRGGIISSPIMFGTYKGGGAGPEITGYSQDGSREYRASIFFTQGPIFHTGLLSLSYARSVTLSEAAAPYLRSFAGVGLLVWMEGSPDFILPFVSFDIGPQLDLNHLQFYGRVRTMAAYSPASGAILGLSYTMGIGLNL